GRWGYAWRPGSIVPGASGARCTTGLEVMVLGLDKCPECGSRNLKREGRCITCADCGWSSCPL
ncbi:MAG: hypothetical protein QXI18_04110, partial [Nitrososphaerota archaeon]